MVSDVRSHGPQLFTFMSLGPNLCDLGGYIANIVSYYSQTEGTYETIY